MSTSYRIAQQSPALLELDEASNKLSLIYWRDEHKNEAPQILLSRLEPEELVNLALNLLQVSLYWHRDNEAAQADIIKRIQNMRY